MSVNGHSQWPIPAKECGGLVRRGRHSHVALFFPLPVETPMLNRLAVSAFAAFGLALVPCASAAEKYSQKPEEMQAVAKGAAANDQPAKSSDPGAWTKGPAPEWIWGTDTNKDYTLRRTFQTKAKAGKLKTTADNRCSVKLNGHQVATSDAWERAAEADVSKYLVAGENVIEAKIENDAGSPAAFIFKLILEGEGGKAEYVVSDKTWTIAGGDQLARVIAKLGEGPWGDPLSAVALSGSRVPANTFQVLPGFKVEKLFTVPKDKLGSWVSITFDNKGRLIASDQEGKGLCRITLPKPGSNDEVQVEHLDVKISAAQGMLYAFDALYLSVNGGPGSGLYRAKDINGDDQFDTVEKLATFNGGGEHGPHALRLTPDGKSILVACGNHTQPPSKLDASRVPRNWAEDHLLPRNWDGNGHARGILAPGGWIAKTDPEGKTWEIVSSGYRNQYDFDLNADGEMFAYDADMEWDYGTPWYRPTRVNHATSGSELGWRSGTGKWPGYYLDSLPAMVDIGPGSPVGVCFGYGTKFPAKYQKALFICDWTFGTMYAIHMTPSGSTYSAIKEEFVSRTPLPLTDNAVGPDGALYFTVGGRGTQSELFRVTYAGEESTAKVDAHDKESAELRQLRKQIEAYHQPADDGAKAVEFVYPHLAHKDRFIRYAARVALEHQKPELWQSKVLSEKNVQALLEGTVAFARQADKSLAPKILAVLEKVDFASLSEQQQLDYLRALSLVFIRSGNLEMDPRKGDKVLGEPDKEVAARFVTKLDGQFPGPSGRVNRELCSMLVYLQSPTIVKKALAEIAKPSPPPTSEQMADLLARNPGYGGAVAQTLANSADPQKFHYLFVLRVAKAGWTPGLRKAWFEFLNDTRTKKGGASFANFLRDIENDAFNNASDADRLAIEALGLRKPFEVKELPKPQGPGKAYSLDGVIANASQLKGRNFENGKRTFAAARCVVCHRFNGDGGATGPDLTQAAGRFQLKDLAEAIVDPSKVISDQYRASVVVADGKEYTGRIVSESNDSLTIVVNPEDSTKTVQVKKADIEENKPSPVSLMPKDLLNQLNEDEVNDLLAYLLSRGDQNSPLFKK
jgi:putative heme-binding domain-containing protein